MTEAPGSQLDKLRDRAAKLGIAPMPWIAETTEQPSDDGFSTVVGAVHVASVAVDLLDVVDPLLESVPVGRLGATALRAVSDWRGGVAGSDVVATLREEVAGVVTCQGVGVAVELVTLGHVPRQVVTPVVRLGSDRWKAQQSAAGVLRLQRAALQVLQQRALASSTD
jgi:hypothetical protein